MSTRASLTPYDPAEPSFVRFGTGSLFLHLGILVLFSLIHLPNNIDAITPVVTVTLIESPTNESSREESFAEVPHLMTVPRPFAPIKPGLHPQPGPDPFPSSPRLLEHVTPHPPIPTSVPPPRESRVLEDHRAIDALRLNNYLKTAQRTMAQPRIHTSALSSLDMPSIPSTMDSTIPSIWTSPHSSGAPSRSLSNQSAVLMARPTGTSDISKSKVGLGKTTPPVYPRIARESGWEGTVLIRVVVQADGTPDGVEVRRSSGHPILDEAAVDAVKRWQFVPAKDGNIPVRSVVEIPINFNLRKEG